MTTTITWRANKIGREMIKEIVAKYIKENPQEYKIVVKGIEMKKKLRADEYASVEGSPNMRGLFEISETLSTDLVLGLDEQTMVWFKSLEGARWFAKEFGQFALPDAGSI